MRIVYLFAVLAFAVDQGSKWLVVHWLDLKSRLALDVVPPFLTFRMGWNDGINFGLLSGNPGLTRVVLIVLAVAISVGLLIWARRTMSRPVTLAGTGLVIGGALANALDRVVYGAVADFLNMSCCGITNPYTFNLADVAIFAGVFCLVAFDDDRSRNIPRDAAN